MAELAQYYPTKFTVERPRRGRRLDQLSESLLAEALEYYERARGELPGGEETARGIERDVMLQIIDQRWREHLAEMDYLREGIHLRAMAPAGPARGVAARGLRDVRPADGRDRRRLPALRHPRRRWSREPSRRRPTCSQATYEAADDPVQALGLAGHAGLASRRRWPRPVPACPWGRRGRHAPRPAAGSRRPAADAATQAPAW